MPIFFRASLVVVFLALSTSSVAAQFGGGSLRGTSVGVSYNSALGDFGAKVKSGYGLAVHTGLGEGAESWSGRGTFGFDQFTGIGALKNIQFVSYGFDIVHKSSEFWYQFGGLGLNTTTYNYTSTSDAGAAGTRNGTNFGLTAGIGFKLGSPDGTHMYVEAAATTLFTGSNNSSWAPIRFGIQF